MSAARYAAQYIARGLTVVPVVHGEKRCIKHDWQNLRIGADEVQRYFGNEPQNVGILLGEPSGGVVDVDLDVPEAAKLVEHFLPPTITSGRESSPQSHWFFRAPGIVSGKWKDTDGKVMVEVRSTGCQTIVEPSVHPSGEPCRWSRNGVEDFTELTASELRAACVDLAAATLVARHLPPIGGRHYYALAVAGYLSRPSRLDAERVFKIMMSAWSTADDADQEAYRDISSIVADTSRNLGSGDKVVGGPTLSEIAPGLPALLARYYGWDERVPAEADQGEPTGGREATQAELLIRYADKAALFQTPDGEAHATIEVGDHEENWPVKSVRFKQSLLRRFFQERSRAPSTQALTEALATIAARAVFDGPEKPVYVRVSGHGGNVYLDLCNDRWEVVEITPEGWHVIPGKDAPVRFVRKDNAAPLPRPVQGGSVDELRPFLNVRTYEDFILIVAFMVGALNPDGPYPVLALQGEQGSAKSTSVRVVRSVNDPAVEPLRAPPRSERDLAIAASGNWTPAFDNLSGIKGWLSDALCRLATGGGFATRELYSDDREVLFSQKRPMILNGIDSLAVAGDLRDRSLIVELPSIPPNKKRTEKDFYRELEAVRPGVLGALLDAVSAALRNRDATRLKELPRMADFAVWVAASEEALPWARGAFIGAYTGNRRAANDMALDADPVAVAVIAFMQDRESWIGTMTELHTALGELANEDVRRSKVWPAAPNALSNRMTRLAPSLREHGIEYEDGHREGSAGTRKKRLKKVASKDRQSRQSCE